jgi:predicted DNA-binding transcriptional regulator YafY
MSKKIDRIKRIRSFLRLQSEAMSVSEIHEALAKRQGMDVSRKTIERDIGDMVEDKRVALILGMPTRYQLIQLSEVEVTLMVDEITHLLEMLDVSSELYQKLKRALV